VRCTCLGSEEEKQAEETSSSDSSDGDEEKNDASVTPSRPRQSKKPKVDEQPDASPPAKKDGGEPAPSPGSIGDQLYIVDCILGRKKDARVRFPGCVCRIVPVWVTFVLVGVPRASTCTWCAGKATRTRTTVG
jgi:hypothetical protein